MVGDTINVSLYYPLSNWTESISGLPDLSFLVPFHYFEFFFFAVVCSILLIRFTFKTKPSRTDDFFVYLIYFTPILVAFVFFYFIYVMISSGFYVPYLYAQYEYDTIEHLKIYSVSSGIIMRFV